jgi:hypothetical protein
MRVAIAGFARAHRDAVAGVLAVLVLFRVLFPLAVLAQSPGRVLGGFPRYQYNPLSGDAYGYYSCVRELIAVWQRDARVVGPVFVLAVAAVAAAFRYSRRPALRLGVVVWSLGAVAAVLAESVRFTGAAQVGWPLLWSVPLLPLRALGSSAVRPDVAFGFALAFLLACNGIIVVTSYLLGRAVGLSTKFALIGAALFAFWPVLSLLAGASGSRNGTWQIDLGLSLYSEPLSTALVLVGLLRVLRSPSTNAASLLTGALLGFAVLVRLSNVLILACVLVFLWVWRERDRLVPVVVGALASAPAALFFWPKSYPMLKPPDKPLFALGYARDAWAHSLLWHPSVLVMLVPLALLGAVRASRRTVALLWSCVAATSAFYTFYLFTPIHPRFLFVVLPIVLVFWAAGAALVVRTAVSLYDRPR